MSCRNCKHCLRIAARKEKAIPREEKVRQYQKNARLNYAIASLWKKIAKNWEAKADELAKPIKT